MAKRTAGAKAASPKSSPPRVAISSEICTVDAAARRLELHPKTVLRFIREGRLQATRIGKSYRILRADVDRLAGVPVQTVAAVDAARVTCIVDVAGVGPVLAQKWATVVPAALNTRERESTADLRADVIYEPARSHLKVVITGSPADTIPLIRMVKVWLEQLTDR